MNGRGFVVPRVTDTTAPTSSETYSLPFGPKESAVG